MFADSRAVVVTRVMPETAMSASNMESHSGNGRKFLLLFVGVSVCMVLSL